MKLPETIKGFNKIRDLEICRLCIDEGVSEVEIAAKVSLTQRRIRQILRTNKIFLKVDREFEKAKRINLIRAAIKNSKESTKDRADLIEQLRKEIEGDKPLIDLSQHQHFTIEIKTDDKNDRSPVALQTESSLGRNTEE